MSLFLFLGKAAANFEISSNSCYACHKDLKNPRLRNPVAAWDSSLHAKVGNTCEGCHGGDPTLPGMESMAMKRGFVRKPQEGQATRFCGKCHQSASSEFQKSPHYAVGNPTCIQCHGSHAIARFGDEIIREDKCGQCHDYTKPEELRNLILDLRKEITWLKEEMVPFKDSPLFSLQIYRDKLNGDFQKVRVKIHALEMESIREKAQAVRQTLQEAWQEIDRLKAMSKERKWLGLTLCLLFLASAWVVGRINQQNKSEE